MPDSPFRIFPPLSGRFASSSLPPIPSPFFLPFFLSFFIQFLPPFLSSSLFSFLPLFFLPPTPTLRHFSFRIYPATPLAYFTAAALPSSFSSAAAPNTSPKPGRPVPHIGPPKHPGHAAPPACLSSLASAAAQPNSAHIHAQNKGPELHSSGPPTFKQSNYNETKEFPSFTESRRVHRHGKRPVPATGRTVGSAARDPSRKPFE